MELHRARARAPGSRAPRRCRRRARRASPRRSSDGATAKPWFWLVTSTWFGPLVEHRVVRAAVAEGQLERLVAGGEREQLVAEADAEDGHAAEQRRAPSRPRRRAARGRRARSRAGRRRSAASSSASASCGKTVTRRAGPGEPAQDRALAAVVDDRDAASEPASLKTYGSRVETLGGERAAGHRRLLADGGDAPRRPTPSPATAIARIAPASRRCRTSERVSIPVSATIPCSCSQSVQAGPRASRMSTARACGRGGLAASAATP